MSLDVFIVLSCVLLCLLNNTWLENGRLLIGIHLEGVNLFVPCSPKKCVIVHEKDNKKKMRKKEMVGDQHGLLLIDDDVFIEKRRRLQGIGKSREKRKD
ncbi:hypothetical protein B9Z55_020018 [Caenorhabditis nigoni]|uniref:Uncharacterized protein n=1 Tax=Caenorhabditis nigoni TaxID=1611254 RepID=A0A2G5TKX3_9PELO|nr:hypothetical protein B9Z55_020018 [Caenorhabditis nigoni]